MLWLDSPPWGRWLLAIALATLALWVELRPDPTVEHPFAVTDIASGEEIGPSNTELRRVPRGLFEPLEAAVTARPIRVGEPVLASALDAQIGSIPAGWWVVAADIPTGSTIGSRVKLVILSTSVEFEAVIATEARDDPFSEATGAVAVAPGHAAEVAIAVANHDLAVLVSTG